MLHSKADLSALLQVSVRTIERLMREHRIGYSRIGTKVVFTDRDIEDFVFGAHVKTDRELESFISSTGTKLGGQSNRGVAGGMKKATAPTVTSRKEKQQ